MFHVFRMAAKESNLQMMHFSDEEDDDDDEEGWEECLDEDDIGVQCICLFCAVSFPSPEMTFSHCTEQHQFNIYDLHQTFQLDCFSYIKLINFIRQQCPEVSSLYKRQADGRTIWDDDENLKPVLEDDGLLQFDIEDLPVDGDLVSQNPRAQSCEAGGQIVLSVAEHAALLDRLRQAEGNASLAQDQLQHTVADLEKMRLVAKHLVLSDSTVLPRSDQAIEHLQSDEDEAYFDSYGHFSIHQEMLQDTVRTSSYRDAILNNMDLFKDKTVLDIGCGTGILSMFAAKAGAKLVLAVEMSDIAYQAMDIVRENGLQDKVKVIKGRMEQVDLPVEKVDIIISEWMGYFLLFESMLDTVIWARNHYLSDGGVMLPNKCSVYLLGLDDEDLHRRNVVYWKDVYGFKMTCMRSCVMKEASVMVADKEKIVTEPSVIKELDLNTCETKDLDFSSDFTLSATKDARLTAVVAYFDTIFSAGANQIHFSTSPFDPITHWKQTVLLLQEPIDIIKGGCVEGRLTCRKNQRDPRSLVITLKLRNNTMTYMMQ